MSLRCECGRYAKFYSYEYNPLTAEIKDVKVNCSRCGVRITLNWYYEQIRGSEVNNEPKIS